MKHIILSASVLLMLVLPVSSAQSVQSGLINAKTAYLEDASNANPTVLPAVSGVTYTLISFVLSTSAADTFYFKCGANQKTARVYLSANSGLERNYFPTFIRCGAGEALTVVKGNASSPVGLTVIYLDQNP